MNQMNLMNLDKRLEQIDLRAKLELKEAPYEWSTACIFFEPRRRRRIKTFRQLDVVQSEKVTGEA